MRVRLGCWGVGVGVGGGVAERPEADRCLRPPTRGLQSEPDDCGSDLTSARFNSEFSPASVLNTPPYTVCIYIYIVQVIQIQ